MRNLKWIMLTTLESKSISIILRPRPLTGELDGVDTGLHIVGGDNGLVRVAPEKGKQLEVTFDHILDAGCAQVQRKIRFVRLGFGLKLFSPSRAMFSELSNLISKTLFVV